MSSHRLSEILKSAFTMLKFDSLWVSQVMEIMINSCLEDEKSIKPPLLISAHGE